MRIAGINENDIADCDDGVCVSLWVQGCPHHCEECHNPETWDFNGGESIDREKVLAALTEAINKNGIKRHLSILGGEPLAPQNIDDVIWVAQKVKEKYPDIKIYLWTGYTIQDLMSRGKEDSYYNMLAKCINILIDGKYDKTKRDVSLRLRGSKNQHIYESINIGFKFIE